MSDTKNRLSDLSGVNTALIDDSLGLLKIDLTIPEEADPVEQFVIHIKDIYRGYNTYNIYHNKWKYSLFKDDSAFQLNKIKMY